MQRRTCGTGQPLGVPPYQKNTIHQKNSPARPFKCSKHSKRSSLPCTPLSTHHSALRTHPPLMERLFSPQRLFTNPERKGIYSTRRLDMKTLKWAVGCALLLALLPAAPVLA